MGEGPEQNPFAPPAEHADLELGRQVLGTSNLATYGQRFAGSVIDSLLGAATAVPGFLVYFGVFREEWAASMSHPEQAFGVVMRGVLIVAVGPVMLAAYQALLIVKTGQTLAKRWLGTRIVREESSELPGFVRGVLLRGWLFFFAGLVPYLGSCVGLADALSIFFGERRQTLHDRVAQTLVIQV